jgi:hypothetical protein
MKRMCIKTLPPLLCIQLKRFGYDWEANRALKFDDYFKVCVKLNMIDLPCMFSFRRLLFVSVLEDFYLYWDSPV